MFHTEGLSSSGRDLNSIGYKPGKELGGALNILLQMVINEEVVNSKEILLLEAKNMLADKRM